MRTSPVQITSEHEGAPADQVADAPMECVFESILTPSILEPEETPTQPACFRDLSLDRIVDVVTARWTAYDLPRFLYDAPTNLDIIHYRQDVMRDLESVPALASVTRFSEQMRQMRGRLDSATHSDSPLERARWFLAAVELYGALVRQLAAELEGQPLHSRGLQAVRTYLSAYITTPEFLSLMHEAETVARDLAAVRYALMLYDQDITVLPCQDAEDYAVQIDHLFARFRKDAPSDDQHTPFADAGRLNHVEAQILTRVAKLYPAPFEDLMAFCSKHARYLDDRIAQLDREVPFYLAYLEAIAPLRHAGLSFTYPHLSSVDKTTEVHGAFDLALAWQLVEHGVTVVCNDVQLVDPERILVVSGPNHGGKTTYARMIGQLHYLARLGYPVPGGSATLLVTDHVLTHFERVEAMWYGRGKLQDELIRIHELLEQATPNSLLILNEIFASTTLRDATYLGTRIMNELSRRDLLAVCVTFLDELATFDAKTVSMVSTVDPHDPTIRTFTLERRPADGLAYAVAIAEKYHVTEIALQRRLGA